MMVLLAGLGSRARRDGVQAGRQRRDPARRACSGSRSPCPVFALAPDQAVFIASMAVYGVALGAVDATTNMQAVALEHLYDRPILPSFHGAWTLGGVIGSAFALATGHLPLSAVGRGRRCCRWRWRSRRSCGVPSSRSSRASTVHVPWRPIIMVGPGDGALLHGRHGRVHLGTAVPRPGLRRAVRPGRAGGVPLPAGQRRRAGSPGDTLVARYGAVPVLRVGAVVACVGLAITVFAPVVAGGRARASRSWAAGSPWWRRSASRRPPGSPARDEPDPALRHARVDAVIGRFNQFNYVGVAARRGDDRAGRRRQPADRLRRADGAGARASCRWPGPSPRRSGV